MSDASSTSSRDLSPCARAEPKQVEHDPERRFIRYDQVLGRGAIKHVYKAFDRREGIEVAWNKVELAAFDQDEGPEQKERLLAEMMVLKQLKHRNIMTLHHGWYDSKQQSINFITEYFTSGTLRQYRRKMRHGIPDQVIKRWAWQVLEGLVYLHGHEPAIIHRDLKCDNIFINGTSGQVKIGDLGLATWGQRGQRGLSIVGTPEFMAPEIYEELYDVKVDIWSYGMCLLELATLDYPYAECRGPIQISRKVSQGLPPDALQDVASQELRQIIQLCICPDPLARPTARQLLKHPYFDSIRAPTPRTSSPSGPPDAAANMLLHLPHGPGRDQAQPEGGVAGPARGDEVDGSCGAAGRR